MGKPLLWRVCGWAAVLLAGFGIGLFVMGALTGAPAVQGAYGMAAVMASAPLAGLWALGTLIHRSRSNRAKINAAAMRAAARQ